MKRVKIQQQDLIIKPLRHHTLGLTQTRTGYGRKLSTRYMIRHEGKLRRVYSCCISNVSTEYILDKDKKSWIIVEVL